MKRKYLFILFGVLMFSCGKTIKLTDVERKWNPYKINEILVFESSEGELDSVSISEINDNVYPDGPMLLKYYEQNLWIYGQKWDSKQMKYQNFKILEISAKTPEVPGEIGFPYHFNNARFAGWGIQINKLDEHETMTIKTKAGKFNDVIKIKSVMPRPARENYVPIIYWSKKNGYIKFERKDGLTWELIKKYVP